METITNPQTQIDIQNYLYDSRKVTIREEINGRKPSDLYKNIQELTIDLQSKLSKAFLLEEPLEYKLAILKVRESALYWYVIDHIQNDRCNSLLEEVRQKIKLYVDETERLFLLPLKPNHMQTHLNDLLLIPHNQLLSNIENRLTEYKSKMSQLDYQILIHALQLYFETGKFPILQKTIEIRADNVKHFAGCLNKIYQDEKGKKLTKEYLVFAKSYLSPFAYILFDETDFRKGNLYKYFKTNLQ